MGAAGVAALGAPPALTGPGARRAASEAASELEEQKAKKPEERRSSKKVVIEEFTLKSGKVSYASSLTLGKALTLPLPSVTVRDIGKASGGTTFAEALTEVLNGIMNGLTQAVTGGGAQSSTGWA